MLFRSYMLHNASNISFAVFFSRAFSNWIAKLKADNGGEYTSNEFRKFCRDKGIQMIFTVLYNWLSCIICIKTDMHFFSSNLVFCSSADTPDKFSAKSFSINLRRPFSPNRMPNQYFQFPKFMPSNC